MPQADERFFSINLESLGDHPLRLFKRVAGLNSQVDTSNHDL